MQLSVQVVSTGFCLGKGAFEHIILERNESYNISFTQVGYGDKSVVNMYLFIHITSQVL